MASAKLQELFSSFYEWRLSRSPEYASLAGESRFDGQLETFTLQRFKEDNDTCLEYLRKAKEIEMECGPSEEDLLKIGQFKDELETFTNGYQWEGFLFPITYLEGVHVDFGRLGNEWMSMKEQKDFANLLQRFEAFPRQVDEIIGVLKEGIKKGETTHEVSVSGVVQQIKGLMKPTKETVFYQPFLEIPDSISNGNELQAKAMDLIEEKIKPAFNKLREFMESEYLKNTRPNIAIRSLGEGFYEACLKFHTSTNLSPQEIHDIGLAEVARIEEEMRKVVDEVGCSNLSLKEFSEKIRNDQSQFYDSPEKLLQAFKDTLENEINPKLGKLFKSPPGRKLDVVETPAVASNAPEAFYIAGTQDGSRPGRFFVNVHMFEKSPKYGVMTLALHEGNPGHHYQACHTMDQDVPPYRVIMEDRSYFLAPSRFPIHTAYMEGWALYAEKLGFDLGLYDDPMDRYGHLSGEIFRACRLVVDTGLHFFNWSIERAVEYMLNHTAYTEENVRNEVNRYITWPGQATGYKIGQLKIIELRKRAEKALGDSFDIKEFHEVVLRNVGSLNVLEEQVDKFIGSGRKQVSESTVRQSVS